MKKYLKKNWGVILTVTLVVVFALLIVFTENQGESAIMEVSADEWISAVKEDDYTVTVLTLSYCTHCKKFLPVMEEVLGEYDFEAYKFETDTISEEDYNAIVGAFKMKNYDGHVPYTVIFKKGEFVADNVGYIDKTATIKLLKDNGVIAK